MQNLKSGSRITKFVSLKIYQTFTVIIFWFFEKYLLKYLDE